MPDISEISDLITDYDASSLVRRDVSKAEVVGRFATLGDTQAIRDCGWGTVGVAAVPGGVTLGAAVNVMIMGAARSLS